MDGGKDHVLNPLNEEDKCKTAADNIEERHFLKV